MKKLGLKVALVHDDLVQWGGAERVLLAIAEVFPDAPIYTSVFDYDQPLIAKNFKSKKIVTSFIQKIPGWRWLYRALLPLYPLSFGLFDFSEYDLVISQTTRFAKCIITAPETTHICYCHTPPRFLWNFSHQSQPIWMRWYLSYLRWADLIYAKRVDSWLAGSFNCQKRLKKIYQVDSEVLQPFVDDQFFQPAQPIGDYFVCVARLIDYKRVDLVVKACTKLNLKLKVIGDGPELANLKAMAGDKVEFLQKLPDQQLKNIIAQSKAVIISAEEDFGLVSLEAQALGRPVIALGKGGSLESVVAGKTGLFFESATVGSLVETLNKFEKMKFSASVCQANAKKFSKSAFKQKLLRLINQSIAVYN